MSRHLCVVLALATIVLSLAARSEPVATIASFTLNGQSKGDRFVLVEDGRWLLSTEELRELGLARAQGDDIVVNGKRYVVLSSLRNVRVRIDEEEGHVDLVADPALFGNQLIEVNPSAPVPATYATSGFLNYALNALQPNHGHGTFGADTELAFRYGHWLFDNQTNYTSDGASNGFTRLGTTVIYDWYEHLTRLFIGDQVTATGDLGQTVRLGGIGIARAYSMAPTLITTPMASMSGVTPVAGQVEVYVDGVRVYTAPVRPGSFEIDNITRYAGLRQVEVVVRDQAGQVVQRSKSAAYLSDRLLGAGFDDFNVAIGVVRREFGIGSDRYDGLGFVAQHRVGVTDSLTVGAHVDRSPDYATAGGDITVRLADFGVVSVEGAAARPQATGRVAAAGTVAYSYVAGDFGLDIFYRQAQQGYLPPLPLLPLQLLPLRDAQIGVSNGFQRYGNLGATVSWSKFADGSRRQGFLIRYNVNPSRQWNIDASIGRSTGQGGALSGLVASMALSYFFDGHVTVTARAQRTPLLGAEYEFDVTRPTPVGPGFGFRADVQRSQEISQVRPFVQLNTATQQYTLGATGTYGGGQSATAVAEGVAGAFAFAEGVAGFTRPINDAFAVVKVDTMESVHVSQNAQPGGQTNADGVLFLPEVGSYVETTVALDTNDVPLDILIKRLVQRVVPPLRGGVLIAFDAHARHSVTGILILSHGKEESLLAGIDTVLTSSVDQVQLFTAGNGEFFVEDAAPGEYRGEVRASGATCMVTLVVPALAKATTDVGRVFCAVQ